MTVVATGLVVGAGSPAMAAEPTLTVSSQYQSGAIGDPTNPTVTVTLADDEGPVEDLVLSVVSSSNASMLPVDNVMIAGSGSERVLTFEPVGVGFANLRLRVEAPDGRAREYGNAVRYAASAASITPATTRWHTLTSDASTAVALGDGSMIVADDEFNSFAVYDRNESGPPLTTVDATTSWSHAEIDIEAAARAGDRIYWSGSLGNKKSGSFDASRNNLIATEVTGSGANTEVTFLGRYANLRQDLVAWDQSNGHGLGSNALGFAASVASGVVPNIANGFNVEGMEFAPGSTTTVYLAFRAPLLPPDDRRLALIVPVENVAELVTGNPTTGVTADFGDPILLDLGGRAIRDIRKNADDEYVILAGSANDDGNFALYQWNGDPARAPRRMLVDLDNGALGSWEAIPEVPTPIEPGAMLQLLVDNGDNVLYGSGSATKDYPRDPRRKFRSDVFELTELPTGPRLLISPQSIDFGEQHRWTTGEPRQIALTNVGTEPVTIDALIPDAGFVVEADTCGTAPVAASSTCYVDVAFAPEELGPYAGSLTIVSNDPLLTPVDLAGTAIPLPLPAEPTGTSAYAVDGGAVVSWNAPAVSDAGPLGHYVVTPHTLTATLPAVTTDGPQTHVVVDGLANGTTYWFEVAAENRAGLGPQSSRSNAVTPRADGNATVHGPAQTLPLTTAQPMGLAVGDDGTVYVAQRALREVAGLTADGSGARRYVPAGLPKNATVVDVAVGPDGAVYVADANNEVVLRFDPDGTGQSVVALALDDAPEDIHVDAAGTVFALTGDKLFKLPAGSAQTEIPLAELYGITGQHFAIDAAGDVLITDGTAAVHRLPADGGALQTIPVTTIDRANTIAVDGAGNIYVGNLTSPGSVGRMAADGAMPTVVATVPGRLGGLAVDAVGNLYSTSSSQNGLLRMPAVPAWVAVPGAPTGVIGRFGDASAALTWEAPQHVGSDPIERYEVTPHIDGVPQDAVMTPDAATTFTLAGLTNATAYTFVVTAHNAAGPGPASAPSNEVIPAGPGAIVTFAGTGSGSFRGDGDLATLASLNRPTGVAVDSAGNTYIADYYNRRVRKVAPDGTISTFAGRGEGPFSGDGGPATDAVLGVVTNVAVDAADNVYIATDGRILKVDSTGTIRTFAGTGNYGSTGDGGPALEADIADSTGMAFDRDGNLYISAGVFNRIRKIDTNGIITTVAGNGPVGGGSYGGDGGLATEAQLNSPSGLTVDDDGNLYIVDTMNSRIRMVDTNGIITTFAGNGSSAPVDDGLPATEAAFFRPIAATYRDGQLYVSTSSRIYVIDRDGLVWRVAGEQSSGYAGDGGPAIDARVDDPRAMTFNGAGDLLIADSDNNRVRRIIALAGSVPDEGDQTIHVVVPEITEPGEFIWSIHGGDRSVDLTEASNQGGFLQSTGSIVPIAVTDTRAGGPEWSIAGQVSDFTGGLPGRYLGWTPNVVTPGAGAVAGDPVEPGLASEGGNGDGLTGPSVLAAANTGHAGGTAMLGAALDLRLPVETPAGTYTATLTITALS